MVRVITLKSAFLLCIGVTLSDIFSLVWRTQGKVIEYVTGDIHVALFILLVWFFYGRKVKTYNLEK